jgi:RNase P/RNase MRP subunit p30
MADNDVAYAFSFSDLLNAPPYMQSIVLGRMYQNLMIAKKYKVKVIFASFATTQYELRNEKDMKCLV